jgi:hypothetical protein
MTLTLSIIKETVAREFRVRVVDLESHRRQRAFARPRQVAMWFAESRTVRTLPEIGRAFGGRDHTTVMHAVARIRELIDRDPDLREHIDAINARLDRLEVDLTDPARFQDELEKEIDVYLGRLRRHLLTAGLDQPQRLLRRIRTVVRNMTREMPS